MEDQQFDQGIIDSIQSQETQPELEIIYEGDEGYHDPSQKEVSDESEGEPHEAQEEESEEAEAKPRKPRVPAKQRINDLSRRYHTEARRAEKAEIELSKLKEENERLKRISESQNKSVVSSQESMIATNILHARQLQAKAIEDGDIEAQVNASEALAAAMADKRRLEEFKMQQKMAEEDRQYQEERERNRQQYYRPQEYQEEEVEATPEAVEWVSENSWFDENSSDFDPDLHQKAFAYAQYLDRDYLKKGKQDLIGKYEYFDDLNRYMNRHLQPVSRKISHQGGLVMNRPKAPVAGVNRGTPSHGGQRERFFMSRDEQQMAKAMGWSDQQWFENKKLAERLEKSNRLITRS